MNLQKQLSKKIGDKKYAKWVLVIPPKSIELLGWKAKEKLKAEVKGDKLVIQKDWYENLSIQLGLIQKILH